MNETLLNRIHTYHNDLSDADLAISDYLVKNVAQLSGFSVKDLSTAAHASTTTLSCFVKKISYASYHDFKFTLMACSSIKLDNIRHHSGLTPVNSCRDPVKNNF